jgi:hypothetical protein
MRFAFRERIHRQERSEKVAMIRHVMEASTTGIPSDNGTMIAMHTRATRVVKPIRFLVENCMVRVAL